MQKVLLVLMISLFSFCQNRAFENSSEAKVKDTLVANIGIHVVDSLLKYSSIDSMLVFGNENLYVGKANNIEFGLYSYNGMSFEVYQKLSGKWIITDTFNKPLFYVFKPTDLNGDKFDDVIITYAVASAGGNGINLCLLFDPKLKIFRHNPYFDLPNIEYDKAQNLVLSAWWGGVTHCQEKMSYKIVGDSLEFYNGVIFCPKNNVDNEEAGVQFYTMKNGKRIVTKTIKGDASRTWQIFEKSIFNSKDDF